MSRYAPHPSVVCTVLEDGGVLLHLDTKYYYSLNGTALLVWSLLESGHADPAGELARRYPLAPDRDTALASFLADLEKEQLASPAADPIAPAAAPPDVPGNGAWAAPRLIRHDVPLNQILSNPFDPCVPLAE